MIPQFVTDNKIIRMLAKLWDGEYSLAKAFWGFYVLGTMVAFVCAMISFTIFSSIGLGDVGLSSVGLFSFGYRLIATVGVWRSATRYSKDSEKLGSGAGKSIAWITKFWLIIVTLRVVCKSLGITYHGLLTILQ